MRFGKRGRISSPEDEEEEGVGEEGGEVAEDTMTISSNYKNKTFMYVTCISFTLIMIAIMIVPCL